MPDPLRVFAPDPLPVLAPDPNPVLAPDPIPFLVPDPNRFGGDVMVAQTGGDWETKPHTHGHTDGEFRSIGVADMAASILAGRPHRTSGALALHVLEAMEAFQLSSNQGRRIKLETPVERPAMLPVGCTDGQLD